MILAYAGVILAYAEVRQADSAGKPKGEGLSRIPLAWRSGSAVRAASRPWGRFPRRLWKTADLVPKVEKNE